MTSKANNAEAIGRGNAPAIAIFIFGRQGYAHFAETLALTLKEHSPTIPIHLWVGYGLKVERDLFTEVHELEEKWHEGGPGRLKLSVHEILPNGDWLYLDADMLNLSDLTPYMEKLKAHDFAIEVKGSGGENDNIPYTPWASQTTIKEVNGFDDGATYYGVQSSWMWIRKGSKLASEIFYRAQACSYVTSDLKEPWGIDIPDELCIATALTALGIKPHSEDLSFYGSGHEFRGMAEVAEKHPLACLYGDNKKHRLIRSTWFTMYDRMVRKLYMKHGRFMKMDLYRAMDHKYTLTK